MKLFENMTQARPFIKWVVGKTQLLDEVRKSLPLDFASRQHITYVDPFVGGGAVMFWILQAYPNIERAVINESIKRRKAIFVRLRKWSKRF